MIIVWSINGYVVEPCIAFAIVYLLMLWKTLIDLHININVHSQHGVICGIDITIVRMQEYFDGLVQEGHDSIASAVELCLDGLVQERHNSIAKAL